MPFRNLAEDVLIEALPEDHQVNGGDSALPDYWILDFKSPAWLHDRQGVPSLLVVDPPTPLEELLITPATHGGIGGIVG